MKQFSVVLLLLLAAPLGLLAHSDETRTLADQREELAALERYLSQTFYLSAGAPLSEAELERIVADGVTWIANAQTETGRFAYEYEPYTGEYRRGDNIVRQAGTLYALGEIARRDPDHTLPVAATIEEAIAHFASLAREDEFLKMEFRCIVENQDSERCRLGAASLVLLGMLGYLEVYPEREADHTALMNDLVTYILNAQQLTGGFRDSHYIGENAQPNAELPFSNGEALLALVRYYDHKPTVRVQKAIDRAYRYLTMQPYDAGLYLWIAAASKEMQALWPEQDYATYIEGFTDWRIRGAVGFRGHFMNTCGYVEGLASAYSVLDGAASELKLDLIKEEIDYWNRRNSYLQIGLADEHRFALSEDNELELLHIANMDQAYGGFLTSGTELTQRIDFTQHCITAYAQTLVDLEGGSL